MSYRRFLILLENLSADSSLINRMREPKPLTGRLAEIAVSGWGL